MGFELRKYTAPDFNDKKFVYAPDAVLEPAPKDGVVPEKYHAMSIFPEYFKIEGKWILDVYKRQARHFTKKGRYFDDPTLKMQLTADELKEKEAGELPNFIIAFLPIVLILVLFNGLKWTVEGAVFAGVVLATVLMFKRIKGGLKEWVNVFNKGAADSGVAILNTAIVVGFGGVVQNTEGFTNLITMVQNMNISPLVFVAIAVAICAGACGSASGGMGVAFNALDVYKRQG